MDDSGSYIGRMAEWSIAAVLKTVEGHTSGGSNPSPSAIKADIQPFVVFVHSFTHPGGRLMIPSFEMNESPLLCSPTLRKAGNT